MNRLAEVIPLYPELLRLTADDLRVMGLPERHWTAKLTEPRTIETEESICSADTTIERWVDILAAKKLDSPSLVLNGPSQVGKTTIAAVMAKCARMHYKSVFWRSIFQLREEIGRRRLWDDDLTVRDRADMVDVLVLDDLKAADATSKAEVDTEWIVRLVRQRYDACKVTILTTSMGPDELDSVLGSLNGYVRHLVVTR